MLWRHIYYEIWMLRRRLLQIIRIPPLPYPGRLRCPIDLTFQGIYDNLMLKAKKNRSRLIHNFIYRGILQPNSRDL